MVSIFQKNLKKTKKLRQELTQVQGLGFWKSNKICEKLGFNPNLRVKQLNFQQIDQLIAIVTNEHYIGLELKQLIRNDIQRLVRISCYKGFRHNLKLPVRGQRTHTNAKTVRKTFV